jgi:hypothetical protein
LVLTRRQAAYYPRPFPSLRPSLSCADLCHSNCFKFYLTCQQSPKVAFSLHRARCPLDICSQITHCLPSFTYPKPESFSSSELMHYLCCPLQCIPNCLNPLLPNLPPSTSIQPLSDSSPEPFFNLSATCHSYIFVQRKIRFNQDPCSRFNLFFFFT